MPTRIHVYCKLHLANITNTDTFSAYCKHSKANEGEELRYTWNPRANAAATRPNIESKTKDRRSEEGRVPAKFGLIDAFGAKFAFENTGLRQK